ncbi:MAG: M56 family metallopeptidase [Acutalibacteraceae bacterium]
MSEAFIKVVNMSISASWIVLAVLLLRPLLRKAPKWIPVLLWGIVAVRLICPFSVESALSLIPSAETISPGIMTDATPQINTGITFINSALNPVIGSSLTPDPVASANPLQILIPVLSVVWVVGIALMLAYSAVSYLFLLSKVRTAVRLRENIFQSENVSSSFVLGIIRPRIYLPFQINARDMEHVIAHEEAHICRKDHLWKPLGFLLLALHWFNPLMWLGYVLLCRDIEFACDEKVVRKLDSGQRADYSQALLTCSVKRRMIATCPLAFGEVGVKDRVKSVLNYKKPAFWIIVAAIVISIAAAVCFLTDPADKHLYERTDNDVNEVLSIVIDCGGCSCELTDAPSKESVLAFLGELKISRMPVSLSRSEDRERSNSVTLVCEKTSISYYFNSGCSSVWVSDGVKPSLTNKVYAPGTVKQFLESIIESYTSNVDTETYRTYTFGEHDNILNYSYFVLHDDGKFSFMFSLVSSYIGHGDYTLENDRLTLKTEDGKYVYCFDMVGDTMVFDAKASSKMLWFSQMYDGCVFNRTYTKS